MKLQPKHIQHYPIGGENALRFLIKNGDKKSIYKLNTIEYNSDSFYGYDLMFKDVEDCDYWMSNIICDSGLKDSNVSIKLLLRPMSDLYREIDGKIGIVEIYKMIFRFPYKNPIVKDNTLKFGRNSFEWIPEFKGFSTNGDHAFITLEVADYLDENHYDWRYDLIEQNLAIDKNSIG